MEGKRVSRGGEKPLRRYVSPVTRHMSMESENCICASPRPEVNTPVIGAGNQATINKQSDGGSFTIDSWDSSSSSTPGL